MDSMSEASRSASDSGSESSDSPEPKITSTTKYLHPDSQLFRQYTQAIQKGFQEDCENYISEYAKFKSTSFTTFTDYWINSYLGKLFMSETKFVNEELPHIANNLFFVIRKFIKYGKSIYVKVAAFYLLHAVYCALPQTFGKVSIDLTHPELTNILEISKKLAEKDFLVVFHKLKAEGAFRYVATETQYGIDPRFIWQPSQLVDDIAEGKRELKEILRGSNKNCAKLIASSKAYDEALTKYEEKTGETARVPCREGNTTEQIAAQFKAIEEEFIRFQELHSD